MARLVTTLMILVFTMLVSTSVPVAAAESLGVVATQDNPIETSEEWRITVKFTRDRASEIEAWLMENHPYDEPQWLAVAVEEAGAVYAAWVKEETRP